MKSSSPCSGSAWEPPGPWAPSQRRNESSPCSLLPQDGPTGPSAALTKCHIPLVTRKWPFACTALPCSREEHSPRRGAPPHPARKAGPGSPREGCGMPRWHWASPRCGSTGEDVAGCAFPTFPPFSPRVMNSPIIAAVIQEWAKFLHLGLCDSAEPKSVTWP